MFRGTASEGQGILDLVAEALRKQGDQLTALHMLLCQVLGQKAHKFSRLDHRQTRGHVVGDAFVREQPVEVGGAREHRVVGGGEFLLGADAFGRDILSRIIYGARVTLTVSVASVGIGVLVGGALGTLAGYFGGLLDTIVMRIMDVLLAFPYLLLAIIIVSALGPGLVNTVVAIGIWTVPAFARIARGSVAGIRERDFVDAARSLGARDGRIVGRDVVPHFVATPASTSPTRF